VDVAPQTDWPDAVIAVQTAGSIALTAAFVSWRGGPQVAPGSVVNAASFASGAVAPGEIVSVFGTGVGPVNALTGTVDAAGKLATALGDVTLRFDGQAAPLFYAGDSQINAQVPLR